MVKTIDIIFYMNIKISWFFYYNNFNFQNTELETFKTPNSA